MDMQMYRTRRAAQAEVSTMRGWPDVHIVRIYLGADNPANEGNTAVVNGKTWVIECAPGQYLRTDGYVR